VDSHSGSPGGEVRTFLIADVRGYTHFTEEHGDEQAAELAKKFARLARDTVADNGGEVIELRGDEALAVFTSARLALCSAVELQRRSRTDSALPLGIGIGLDAGEAMPVDGGYRGGALNLASRLCGMAAPGQILASETVVGLARKVDGVRFAKRRPARLKGMEEPVPVIEAVPDPPLPPLRALPRVGPSFVHRHRWPLLAAAAAAVTLAVALPLILTSSKTPRSGATLSSIPQSFYGLVRVDPRTWAVLQRVPLSGNFGEGGGAIADGSMWFSGSTGVDRVDLHTGRLIAHIPVSGGGAQLAGGADEGIWFASHAPEDNAIWGIDVGRNEISQHVKLPTPPYAGPYVGEGFVWVASANTIWKISPSDGRIRAAIPYDWPPGPPVPTIQAASAGQGALWIANPTALPGQGLPFGGVARIDANTDEIVQIPVKRPNGVAVGGGAVWVRSGTDLDNYGTGDITEINPSTNQVVRRIPLGHPDWVTASQSGILVEDGGNHKTDLLNPATGKVIRQIVLPRGFGYLGEWNGSYWLARLRFE
jgi:class 3 adenylate cyclase